jgi:hypothetical protein
MMSPKSSGSKLTASAVEPTSPHDSTVNCRLSGSERGAARPWPGVPAGMASPRFDPLTCSGSMAGGASPFAALCGRTSHGEDEPWRLRVRLYLAPQTSDEHIDAAVIWFRATSRNGVTELGHTTVPGEHCLRMRSAARSRRGSAALETSQRDSMGESSPAVADSEPPNTGLLRVAREAFYSDSNIERPPS